MSAITIAAKMVIIKAQAEKMRELASKIESRSYRLEFEQGEGAFVRELEAMSAELRSVGSALGSLVSVTADRLDSAAAEFAAANEQTAGLFRG